MKKIMVIFLIVFLFVPSLSFASSIDVSDSEKVEVIIKGHTWGDSKESVIIAEGEPEGTGMMDGNVAEYIYYKSNVVGLDAMIIYYFTSEGLCEIRYALNESHSNDALYIDDYNKVKEAIISKYGEPLSFVSGEHWDNNNHKEYYKDKKGAALSYGYLTYKDFFFAKDAEIVLKMSADNYNISTVIAYISSTIIRPEPNYDGDI